MQIINERKLHFNDVYIRPSRSSTASRKDVNLIRTFYLHHKLECIPIIISNMDTTGTMAMAMTLAPLKILTCLHKHYSCDDLIQFFKSNSPDITDYVFVSIGIGDMDILKLTNLQLSTNYAVKNICIDVANGYTDYFVARVNQIREQNPNAILMAGNVVTPEMVEELILHAGVSIIKCGIGNGSVCSTTNKTGVGYPQLSCVIECANSAHALGAYVCSDGGCKEVGDIAKAFGGGADFVMLGGMFAGTDECEGEWEWKNECQWNPISDIHWTGCLITPNKIKASLKFYGMSSCEAMEKYHGGIADYRTDEGKCITVPYKGKATEIAKDIMGGLRSTCAYVGATKIKYLPKRTTFVMVK